MMRLFLPITLLSLMSILSGCQTPYSMSVQEFDESDPQSAAVIEISNPQIYTRESLINDRKKEIERLQELLDASKTATFVPQLRRDLREISGFSASLQAAFNPAAGQAAQRAAERKDLEQEIAVTKLRTDLATAEERLLLAERRLEALEAGETPEGQPQSGGNVSLGDETKAPQLPNLTRLDKTIADLRKLLNDVSKATALADTTIPSTPQEKFRDEQAYRSEIRAAIAETNLDDVHDVPGNALYRLQFRATVLPGEKKSKYGVARIRLNAPELRAEDIQELYFAWLGYVSVQLNLPARGGRSVNWRYETLGTTQQLYDIVYYPYPAKDAPQGHQCPPLRPGSQLGANCELLRLAVLPPFGPRIQEFLNDVGFLSAFVNDLQRMFEKIDIPLSRISESVEQEIKDSDECKAALNSDWIQDWIRVAGVRRSPMKLVRDIQTLERFLPTLDSSVHSLQTSVPHLKGQAARPMEALLRTLNQFNALATAVMTPMTVAFPNCRNFDVDYLKRDLRTEVPQAFLSAVAGVEELTPGTTYIPKGEMFTYSAQPVELVQRLSTAASAATSFELALSIAAAFPQAGANAQAGAGFLRSAIGRMETLERAPIVVGFSSPRLSDANNRRGPEFGWVFGPAVVPRTDESELQLRQRIVNHQVIADVSIPGWWPKATLKVKTAWIANWHNGQSVIANEPAASKTIDLRLPVSHAGLESLTDTVTQAVSGRHPGTTLIYDVEPKWINFCSNQTASFLIYGNDLWRNAAVFLNGVEADSGSVRVLPDMTGITATFSLAEIPFVGNAQKANEAIITIWTQSGSDTFPGIKLISGNAENCPKTAPNP